MAPINSSIEMDSCTIYIAYRFTFSIICRCALVVVDEELYHRMVEGNISDLYAVRL